MALTLTRASPHHHTAHTMWPLASLQVLLCVQPCSHKTTRTPLVRAELSGIRAGEGPWLSGRRAAII